MNVVGKLISWITGRGTNAWDTTIEATFRKLDAIAQPNAVAITNTLPSSASEGTTYIIGTTPTGVAALWSNRVARWSGIAAAWESFSPVQGWIFCIAGTYYAFNGFTWQPLKDYIGAASVDVGGKLLLSQMPDAILGQVKYQGTWSAATNTPALSNPATSANQGYYYICSAAGTALGLVFAVGDWIISDGTTWDKVDNTDAVMTVAGRIGNVTLTTDDVGEGSNLYFLDSRAGQAVFEDPPNTSPDFLQRIGWDSGKLRNSAVSDDGYIVKSIRIIKQLLTTSAEAPDGANFTAESPTPMYRLRQADAAADRKDWIIYAIGGKLRIACAPDSGGFGGVGLEFTHNGSAAPDAVAPSLGLSNLGANAIPKASGASGAKLVGSGLTDDGSVVAATSRKVEITNTTSANYGINAGLRIKAPDNATIALNAFSDSSPDESWWQIQAATNTMRLDAVNDAGGAIKTWLRATRTAGTGIASVLAFFGVKITMVAPTATYASMNLPSGVAPTAPVLGDAWTDNNRVQIVGGVSILYQTGQSVVITGTTTETSMLSGSGIGSKTLPANFWTQNKRVRLRIVCNNPVATGYALKVKVGSSVIASLSISPGASGLLMEAEVWCVTAGVSGTLNAYIIYHPGGGAIQTQVGSATVVNTTIAAAFDFTATPTNSGNQLIVNMASCETLG